MHSSNLYAPGQPPVLDPLKASSGGGKAIAAMPVGRPALTRAARNAFRERHACATGAFPDHQLDDRVQNI